MDNNKPAAGASKAVTGKKDSVKGGSSPARPAAAAKRLEPEKKFFGEAFFICIIYFIFIVTAEWKYEYDIELCFAIGAGIVFFSCFFRKADRRLLFARATPIFIMLLAQCLLYFAGTFYGAYPRTELQQFFLNIGGLFIFMTAYMLLLRKDFKPEALLAPLAVTIAVASLISIESASSGFFHSFFEAVAEMFGTQLPDNYGIFEANTRLQPVLGNANVFAPLTVYGMFTSLWMSGKPGQRSIKSGFYMAVAIVCGATFVLCFSMGTILTYIPALLGILLLAKKEDRGAVFISNIFCVLIAAIEAAIVFKYLDSGAIPVLSVIILSAASALLYTYIKLPEIEFKLKKAHVIGTLVGILIIIILAAVLRGPYAMTSAGAFRRAIALDSGTYELSAEFDSSEQTPVSVEIYSMSYTEAALKEKTVIATLTPRSGEPVEFTVPESSAAVFFTFTAASDVELTDVSVSGEGISKSVPLKYLLAPEFIVNRLQGIWVNDNAIQRFIFFRDGIVLGMKSPILGLGGGAFENGVFSVETYYYETVHTHNEYIQCFVDGGIIGFSIFTALTVFAFISIIKTKKAGKEDSLLPFVGGCVILLFLHSLLEVDFSYPAYKLAAAVLFALTAAKCDYVIVISKKTKNALTGCVSVLAALTVIIALGKVKATILTSGDNQQPAELQQAISLDPFNITELKVNYIVNSMYNDTYASTRNKYLASLENKQIAGYPLYGMAEYYLLKAEPEIEKGIEKAELYVHEYRTHPQVWPLVLTAYNQVLNVAGDNADRKSQILNSMDSLLSYLADINKNELQKTINPDLAAFSYIRTALMKENLETTTLLDSRITCDLNNDGASDIMSTDSGSAQWAFLSALPGKSAYTVTVYQEEADGCEITFNNEMLPCEYDSENGCFVAKIAQSPDSPANFVIKTDNITDASYFTIDLDAAEE